jgi:hypothetical protein
VNGERPYYARIATYSALLSSLSTTAYCIAHIVDNGPSQSFWFFLSLAVSFALVCLVACGKIVFNAIQSPFTEAAGWVRTLWNICNVVIFVLGVTMFFIGFFLVANVAFVNDPWTSNLVIGIGYLFGVFITICSFPIRFAISELDKLLTVLQEGPVSSNSEAQKKTLEATRMRIQNLSKSQISFSLGWGGTCIVVGGLIVAEAPWTWILFPVLQSSTALSIVVLVALTVSSPNQVEKESSKDSTAGAPPLQHQQSDGIGTLASQEPPTPKNNTVAVASESV